MGRFLESILSSPRKDTHKHTAKIILILACLASAVLIIFNFDGFIAAFTEMGMYLQYKFIQRALIVGILVALCAALLGVSWV